MSNSVVTTFFTERKDGFKLETFRDLLYSKVQKPKEGQMICDVTAVLDPMCTQDLIKQCEHIYSSTAEVETFYTDVYGERKQIRKQLYYVSFGDIMCVLISDSSLETGTIKFMYTEE